MQLNRVPRPAQILTCGSHGFVPNLFSACVSLLSVPAAVNHLKASNRNMTDSLWFSWSPASGDFDFYELILYNPNGTKKENWKEKDVTEWRFQGLVPGRKYTLYVVTHSGDLSNKVTGEGRTGKKPS